MTARFRHLAMLGVSLVCAAGAIGAGSAGAASADKCDGPGIRVLINDQTGGEKVPLPEVNVIITDPSGATVNDGLTNDKGIALLCLEAKGDYTVTVDTETLPDGKALQGDLNTSEITEDTFTTNVKTVTFFTGAAERETDGYWDLLIDAIVNGIRLGVVIAICSVGLSLIFGTTGLTNFAHGELVTFGALVAYLFSVVWDWPFLPSAIAAVILGGLFGLFLDWGLWSRLRARGTGNISQMVVSVGLSIIMINFFLMRFGGGTERFTAYNSQVASKFGPIDITKRDLIAGIISLAALVAVATTLQKSRLGKATRAVSDNPALASTTGIDSAKIIRIVWFIAGSLAALGGVVRGLDEGIKATMGADLIFLMFAGITLGGLGSAYGALVGGFVVGLLVQVSTLGIPAFPRLPLLGWVKDGVPAELRSVPALAILILILIFRPQGILGRKERVG